MTYAVQKPRSAKVRLDALGRPTTLSQKKRAGRDSCCRCLVPARERPDVPVGPQRARSAGGSRFLVLAGCCPAEKAGGGFGVITPHRSHRLPGPGGMMQRRILVLGL